MQEAKLTTPVARCRCSVYYYWAFLLLLLLLLLCRCNNTINSNIMNTCRLASNVAKEKVNALCGLWNKPVVVGHSKLCSRKLSAVLPFLLLSAVLPFLLQTSMFSFHHFFYSDPSTEGVTPFWLVNNKAPICLIFGLLLCWWVRSHVVMWSSSNIF